MRRRVRSGAYSFGDFLELVEEHVKADLIDGNIYMASPESFDHNKIVGFLYRLVELYTEHYELGEVVINKVAFRLTAKSGPEPDVAFVQSSRTAIIKHGYVDGAPDFAIEVVSPDSVDRDYELKREAYESAGVREYWIIDPGEQSATFLEHDGQKFVERFAENHIIRSTAIPGFYVDVRWLWQRPLPATLLIIQQMIAESGPSR
jgi:Uma2 family endonuclease